MMPDDPDFPGLVRRAVAGDDKARQELFCRYHRAIRRAVRRRMPNSLRSQFDTLDFVQDVWVSFLTLPPERVTFAGPDALTGFLARMAYNKLRDALEKRNNTAAREWEFSAPAADPERRVQSPSQFVIAAERWGVLLAELPPGQRAILEQLRDGRQNSEIAAALNIPLRTVERIIRRLKDLCERDV